MKNSIARFCLFFAALTSALAQPTVPVSNLSPVPSGTVVGRSSAGTGRAETLTAGTGITIANGQISSSGGAGDAPANATYITQTPNGTLTNEQPLSLLASGLLWSTTGTGVITSLTMSGDATFASNGVLTLASTAVTTGTYGSATVVPVITVDAKGRITVASNTTITATGNVTAAGTLDSGNIVIGQGAKTVATSSALSVSGSNVTVTGNLAITGSTTFNNLTTSNLTVTGNIVGNLAASQVTIADAGGYYVGTEVESALQEVGGNIVALQSVIGPTPSGNQLISGGGVALAPGGGLDITVSAASYLIQGVSYTSALTDLTLSAADPSNPRIDVVAVNSSGNAVIIEGTAAATPAKPDVDPATQLELTFFLVGAGATELDVDVVDVYLNNAEWTTSTNSAGTINVASTNNPYTGANCIEGTTVTTGNYVRFVKPASGTFDMADSDNLVFYIRSKASWANNRIMSITVRDASSVQLGSSVTFDQGLFGFNSGQTTTYQQIIIPTALFAANGLTASQIQITLGGSGGTVGFYIDDVTLQGGVASITDASRMKWRGNYLASNFYNVNDVVLSSGIQYVAIQAGVGNTPVSSPTFWQASSTSTGGTVTASGTPTSGQTAEFTTATNIVGVANVGNGSYVKNTSPSFTTNMTLANSASPTTGAVAATAFDTDAWAASRGAVQVHDGTANTFLIGTLASDTPSNGQVPTWNTGGTVTWETPAGGGTPGGSDTQVQYNNAGAFGGISGVTANATTMSTAANNLIATSPRIITAINDSGGNELIKFTATGSATNEITVTNAPDGSAPKMSASGSSDANVNLIFEGKGALSAGVNGTTNPGLRLYVSDVIKGSILMSTASGGGGINDSSANDLCFRLDNANRFRFSTDAGTTSAFIIAPLASQVNGITVTPAITANNPSIKASSTTDTNVTLNIAGQGTGAVRIDSTNPTLQYAISAALEASIGIAVGAGSIITGSALGDYCARVSTNAFLFSVDDGTSASLIINSSGQVSAEKTTASTSTTTGALISKGGLGVAGRTSTATLNVGTGTTITSIFSASGAMNFGSINADAEETQTLTVTGVVTTNTPAVALGWSAALEDGIVVKQAWVSGADTVSVRVRNVSGSPIDPASVTVRATVTGF